MINNINFYKEFDNLFESLNINDDNNEKYTKFINLYEKYIFNRIDNLNLIDDIEIKTYIIDDNGLLKSNY
tara:strand:+ start:1008 stop:1217 length:210 start_codon:yes stop_codon:yes gene_type:complete